MNRRRLALSAALATLALAAPVCAASADVVPGGIAEGGQANAPSVCVEGNAPSGIGDAGATENQICGVAMADVASSVGQAATAVGPTIVGSTVGSSISVSLGPVAASLLP
jgi:hypothetical protein